LSGEFLGSELFFAQKKKKPKKSQEDMGVYILNAKRKNSLLAIFSGLAYWPPSVVGIALNRMKIFSKRAYHKEKTGKD